MQETSLKMKTKLVVWSN